MDHYGKRGMSWHGAMLRYWAFDTELGKLVEMKLYFDQICNGDNKQDKEAVDALVEAVMISLRPDVPHITRLTLQSDSALSYQNAYVRLMFPVIGAAQGFTVARYMHSDTQDGKSMLAAHFATATRNVRAWVWQGNDCSIPLEVVKALSSNRGLPNFVAELVGHDRLKGVELYRAAKPMERALAKIIDRANDIFYDFDLTLPSSERHFDLSSCSPFIMRVFAYSDIGEGIGILVDPGNGACSIAIDLPASERSENRYIPARTQNSSFSEVGATTPLIVENTTSDIQRRLCFDNEDEEDGDLDEDATSEVDAEDAAALIEECDVSEDEEDDVGAQDEEVIMSQDITGVLTGIRITTKAQLRRRTRALSRQGMEPLSNRNVAGNVQEKDVEAYAKRSIVELKIGGDFTQILDSAGLAAKMISVVSSGGTPSCSVTLKKGWARRPKRGEMNGAKNTFCFTRNTLKICFVKVKRRKVENSGQHGCWRSLSQCIHTGSICQERAKFVD